MKYFALLISAIGLLSLLFYFHFSSPIELSENILDNEKVFIQGKITQEKKYPEYYIIKLENNVSIKCDNPCPLINKINKYISITTKYNEFYNNFEFLSLQ
jgi:hypothetical protein